MKKRLLSFMLLAFVVFSYFFTTNEVSVNAATKPAKPKITAKVAKNGTDVKITISKTTGADGFRIYMVAPKQSKYSKVKTIKKTAQLNAAILKRILQMVSILLKFAHIRNQEIRLYGGSIVRLYQ